MRSHSLAALLARYGFEACTLERGYKAFRNWADETLMQPRRVCVVAGATGSGKTEVLYELRSLGCQVLDLEAVACHSGSVFGRVGQVQPQPTSEQFRNLMAVAWAALDPGQLVFIEDEGARIGDVCLPHALYAHLRASPLVVQLDVPFSLRAERSLATYGRFGPEALYSAVGLFRGKMGPTRTDELLDQLKQGNLRPVCEEALGHYDRLYEHHLRRGRDPAAIATVPVESLDVACAAGAVLAVASTREAAAFGRTAVPGVAAGAPEATANVNAASVAGHTGSGRFAPALSEPAVQRLQA